MSARPDPHFPGIAVLVSGGGRSLENLAGIAARGELPGRIALVLSNTPKAFAIERAARLGIPSVVIDPERRLSPEEFSRDAFAAIESFGCEVAVMAGFLRLLRIPERWLGRVLNIHPALLPAFPGTHAQKQAFDYGVKVSGCTVHFVDAGTDTGPIIAQTAVPVLPTDDEEALRTRILAEEHRLLPRVVRALAEGRVTVEGRRVRGEI